MTVMMLGASARGADAYKNEHSYITFSEINQGMALFKVTGEDGCSDLIRVPLEDGVTEPTMNAAAKNEEERLKKFPNSAPNSCFLIKNVPILNSMTLGMKEAMKSEQEALAYNPK